MRPFCAKLDLLNAFTEKHWAGRGNTAFAHKELSCRDVLHSGAVCAAEAPCISIGSVRAAHPVVAACAPARRRAASKAGRSFHELPVSYLG